MSETDIELKNDNISTADSDSGASDSHADRHDHGDQERSASVRDAIKSASHRFVRPKANRVFERYWGKYRNRKAS